MYYQPQILNNKCNNAEALFRYKINDTFLNPEVMFALAGFNNFERNLNDIILNKVCDDVNIFKDKLSSNFKVSLNINPELLDKNFYNSFYSTLSQHKIEPNMIGIELLESSPFNSLEKELIENFISNGTDVYLDDFGTGYANTKTLASTPLTHLKFAGELVSGIDTNEENKSLISTTLDYCNKNNIKTVFEHVETEKELDTVNTLSNNSGIIQGYYFSKPLESFELIKFVNDFNQIEENSQL